MGEQYISGAELNIIKGLMYHLDNLNTSDASVGITVNLTDANGDSLGRIEYRDGEYVFVPPRSA